MSVWISSGAFSSNEFSTLQSQARDWGVSHIELSSGMKAGPAFRTQLDARKPLGQTYLVHNYVPAPTVPITLNIASPDDAQLAETLSFVESAIDLTASVNAPFYSLHAGFCVGLPPEALGNTEFQRQLLANSSIDRSAALDRMERVVKNLAAYAARKGVRVLLENNVLASGLFLESGSPYLLTDPKETVRFLNPLQHLGIGLLLDVAHAEVSGATIGFAPDQFFIECGHLIGALHLSQTVEGRDANAPITKDAWFLPHLKNYTDVPFVCEVYDIDQQTALSQMELLQTIKDRNVSDVTRESLS